MVSHQTEPDKVESCCIAKPYVMNMHVMLNPFTVKHINTP